MATRGRKPTPTVLKKLAGNPGKRALNAGEPQGVRSDEVPPPPATASKEVQEAWRQDAPALWQAGLLTNLDLQAFRLLCERRVAWQTALDALAKTPALLIKSPNGIPLQSPLIGIANQASKLYAAALAEFGLTPASRSRVVATPPSSATIKRSVWGGFCDGENN